jgi:hypothetical protein
MAYKTAAYFSCQAKGPQSSPTTGEGNPALRESTRYLPCRLPSRRQSPSRNQEGFSHTNTKPDVLPATALAEVNMSRRKPVAGFTLIKEQF